MAKKKAEQTASDSLARKIVTEVAEKSTDYENNMTAYMASVSEAGDLFRVKPPSRKANTFSNPRQTEHHRAVVAVGTLLYRMLTAADPPFELRSYDLDTDYDKLDTLTHTFLTQMEYANYRSAVLKSCHFAPNFGTVINQFDYRLIGASKFGRKVPTTVMIPRAMDQVMFDRGTLAIENADWLSTADVTSKNDIMRMAYEAKEIGTAWNPKALEAASKDEENNNTINQNVLNRIRRSGFTQDEALKKKKELLMFYGKLDCMNDGIEYVVGIINRKHLVRFHANTSQYGSRPFSVTKWIDWDGPLGLGIYQLFGGTHRSMDANRQKVQDLNTFGAYSMFERKKDSFSNEDAVIGPFKFVDVENMGDIAPIPVNLAAGESMLRLDELLKQEYRSATGASDTLQAIASEATTATSAALSQNEGMRLISVRAEHMSKPLVKDYLRTLHDNNLENIREPFNISKAGIAARVYPANLRCDVDFIIKTTTDKDFSPKRLTELQQLLATLVSTKSSHPDLANIQVTPIVKAIAHMLDVRPSEVIPPSMGAAQMGAADLGGLGMGTMPGMGMAGNAGGVAPVETPVGPVLATQ
jgi:hypothetical protein